MIEPNRQHPLTDFDSSFAASKPEHTTLLIEAFRRTGICFDVTINGPKENPDDENFDIFWFHRDADKDVLNAIIREIVTGEARENPALS